MWSKKQQFALVGMVAVLVCIVSVESVQAAPANDGSIFYDEFPGTALDTNKWELITYSQDPTVADGGITIDSFSGNNICSYF